MAALIISFLSIFYSINLNHVSRQNEQNTKRADTKPIAIAFVSEFEHVAAEIITHCFHSLPNVPTHSLGKARNCSRAFSLISIRYRIADILLVHSCADKLGYAKQSSSLFQSSRQPGRCRAEPD